MMEVSTNTNMESTTTSDETSTETGGSGGGGGGSNEGGGGIKKGCSPSPPMVLIESADERESKRETSTPNRSTSLLGCKSPDLALLHKQLAVIEATDPNELELVMRLINERFPTVKVNFFAGRDQNNNNDGVQDQNDNLSFSKTNESNKNNKNLNADSGERVGEVGARRLSTSSIRNATSVDGGAGLLNMMAIERQESRDSGFWSVSKCSFESMKSLSLTDSTNSGYVALFLGIFIFGNIIFRDEKTLFL